MKERGTRSEDRRIVLEQTGYQLSTQAVCDLLKRQPKIKNALETIQALCDAFYIRLSDFLEVLPSAAQRAKQKTRTLEARDATRDLAKVLHDTILVATPS